MIKAIIFDLDGTISDTQKLHAQVESALLARYGVIISPDEITRQYAGMNTRKVFDEILKNQETSYDLDQIMNEKWETMEQLARERVDAIEGAISLIESCKESGFGLAVASASNLKYVESVLTSLGVKHHFDFLVGGDMVSHGKPDPESFLLAASMLGVEPEHCVVFEDGRSGMTAASTAGMKCVGLVGNTNEVYSTKNLVTSLLHVDKNYLEKLV